MRVLVLGWEYPPAVAGGLGAACHGLTTALADRGHEIVLAVPHADGAPPPLAHPGVTRVVLGEGEDGSGESAPALDPYAVDAPPAPSGARTGATRALYGAGLAASVARYTRHAARRLAEARFDVVHAHDWMTFPAALQLRLACRRPVCLHVHSTAFDRGGRSTTGGRGSIAATERAGVRTADVVCAVSEYTRSVLVREYGVDPRRVRVVHNADRGPLESGGPGRDGPPTVLFVGRLTRQKGVGFLLRAAARVLVRRPDARFVVVGDGEERARLVELAASLGIARSVFFTGSIDDGERDAAYRGAHVFVLSSISEPFGLTPLEALRHGAAVVLTDACGAREVIRSAPVVPPWDARGMADEILGLLDDDARRADLVARGREELGALTWDASAASLEAALDAAVRAPRNRGAAG